MAEKHAAPAGKHAGQNRPASRGVPVIALVVACVVTLALGVFAGHYLLGGSGVGASTLSLNGRTTLSADELDSVVATYVFDGQEYDVTAREVLEEVQGGSSIPANEDGTYTVPSASDVLVYAQNKIILEDAESRGITVTDQEVDEFLAQTYGTSDLAAIAESFGVEEDVIRSMTRDSLIVSKLQSTLSDVEVPAEPTQPTEPEDGNEDAATSEYAEYVIDLLGDEWDSEANDWARTDGEYYDTLSGYEISNDSATYAAASAAYSIAQQNYSDAVEQVNTEYVNYMRTLLSRASIQIGSLAS